MTGTDSPRDPLRRPLGPPPAGVLGMLALVALIELAIGGHRADLAPPWAEDWRFASWAAARQAPGSDVLSFGDSLVKYGVLPRAIEARSGLKAYNLATSAGTMPSAYFLFRQALEAGARPRAVVVDVESLTLRAGVPLAPQNYPELASVGDCAGLAWVDGDPRFLGSTLLAKVLPSYAWRFELGALIRATLDGRSGSQRAAGAAFRGCWEKHRGAQPTAPGRVRHPAEDLLIDNVSPESWAIEPRNEAYLDRFLALAEARGIPAFWLIPPLCPEAHARRARRGTDAAYDRLVRRKQGRFPGLVVLDARGAGYDDSVHADVMHLDRVGASVLSGDVADAVAGRIGRPSASPSWVALPPYAGRAEVATREVTVR